MNVKDKNNFKKYRKKEKHGRRRGKEGKREVYIYF